MKKLVCIFMIVLFSLSMIFCGDSNTSNKLVINSYMSDPEPKRVFDELIKQFKKSNPELEVVVNTYPHEDFKTLLRTWLPSNEAPDVVTWFAGERMRAFTAANLIEPIDDAFDGGFDKYFPKSFLSASSYKDKVYMVPMSWYWWGVYYKKSMFKKYNLTPPTTWEEFLKVCETLKANDITPITIGTKFLWTTGGWFDYLNMRVNGIEFHEKLTAGEIPYTDPKIKKALGYLGDLAKKGYFLDNHSSYTWQEAATHLFTDKAGMYLMGQFIADSSGDDKIKEDLDFFRFPIIDKSVGLYEDTPIDGFMLPAKSKNKKVAKKFLAFIASTQAQEYFAKELGRLAGNKNVAPSDKSAEKGLKMIIDSDGVMQFYDRDSNPEMADKGMNGFVEFMNNPDKLDSILEELEKHRKRIYDK